MKNKFAVTAVLAMAGLAVMAPSAPLNSVGGWNREVNGFRGGAWLRAARRQKRRTARHSRQRNYK